MKRKGFIRLLIGLGVVCAAAGVIFRETLGSLAALAALPFAPIARGLRALSLSDSAGNMAAWALYLALCLAPLAALLRSRSRRSCILAPILSLLLFGGMYLLINPGAAASLPGSAALLTQGGGVMIGGVLWSVIAAWTMLALADRCRKPGSAPVLLGRLLYLSCPVTVAAVCALQAAACANRITAMLAANTGVRSGLWVTELMLVLGAAVRALPALMTVPVTLAAARLPEALAEGFDQTAVEAADILARRAGLALTVPVTVTLIFNLAQLALSPVLRTASWQLELPLTELAFALGALLLARYVRESKELRDENDLFV